MLKPMRYCFSWRSLRCILCCLICFGILLAFPVSVKAKTGDIFNPPNFSITYPTNGVPYRFHIDSSVSLPKTETWNINYVAFSSPSGFFEVGRDYRIILNVSFSWDFVSGSWGNDFSLSCPVSPVLVCPDGTNVSLTLGRNEIMYSPKTDGTSFSVKFSCSITYRHPLGLPNISSGNLDTFFNVSSSCTSITLEDLTPRTTTEILEGIEEESKKQTAIQEEQKETTKGIFASITDFFAGFFENIANAIIGLFVPDAEWFSQYMQDFRQMLQDKTGFIWYCTNYISELLNAVMNADSDNAVLTFPKVEWDGQEIIPATDVDLGEIVGYFPALQTACKIITSIVMCWAVIVYGQNQFKEWMIR